MTGRVALRLRLWQRRILRACLTDPAGGSARALADAAPAGGLETLPVLASFHRVVGPVLATLGDVVPPGVSAALVRLQRDEQARKLIATANLRRSDELLGRLGVPFLVVKGPVLAGVIYDSPRLRFYRDLDLFVPRRSFGRALGVFEQNGAEVVDANWPYFLEHLAGQLDLSTNVDLHWHFLYFESMRRATRVSMEDVFERARQVSVDGLTVSTPDAADTLIHLAVHACLEGGGRLVWMKDIEQAVVNDRPSWDEVVKRAVDWRLNLLVGTMLLRSRQALSTPVPDEVLRQLVPNAGWRAFLRSLDNVFPITAWTRRETPATRVAEATQPEVTATLAVLASAAVRRGRAALPGFKPPVLPGRPVDDTRAAYLDRVAREA